MPTLSPFPVFSAATHFSKEQVHLPHARQSPGSSLGTPRPHTTGCRGREDRAGRTHGIFRYLHVGLLRVHQLLDDLPEAIGIREVAGQRPRRRVLAVPRSFHAVSLGVVKTPAQRSDLFSALRDDTRGHSPLFSTAHQGHGQGLGLCPAFSGLSQGHASRAKCFTQHKPLWSFKMLVAKTGAHVPSVFTPDAFLSS